MKIFSPNTVGNYVNFKIVELCKTEKGKQNAFGIAFATGTGIRNGNKNYFDCSLLYKKINKIKNTTK